MSVKLNHNTVVRAEMLLLVHSYLSGVAQADIENLFSQKVQEKGKWQAWQEMEELRERIDDLSINPHHGECRDDLWHGLLSVRHEDHIVYFRRARSELGVDILAVGSVNDDPAFNQLQSPLPAKTPDSATGEAER